MSKPKRKAERPTPEGGIPRDKDGWPVESAKARTLSLFAPEELTPSPAEIARLEANRKADDRARRKLAKAKRERTEADDDRKVREFAERTGL
jgi:hypothetical protein